jgi:nucleotide-binding universal stress UspA family protein
LLEKAVTKVWDEGLAASGIVLDAPRALAARALLEEAAEWGADVVVVTKPPRRLLGPLAGRISGRAIRTASCPVLVVAGEK